MEDRIAEDVDRKPYAKPEIVHELELETRAGSPIPNFPIDPGSGLDS